MFKKKKDIKDNEIIFYPVDEAAGIYVSPPEAASKAVPEWFKSVPKFTDGEKEFIHYGDRMNLTVKACLPLIDDMYFVPHVIFKFVGMTEIDTLLLLGHRKINIYLPLFI
jgi:hypothetical protein